MSRSRLRRSVLPALVLVATAGAATALSGSPASAVTSAPKTIKAASTSPAVLASISCPSATFCMAVGAGSAAKATDQLAAERWDGARWRRLPVAQPPGVTLPGLQAVACPSSTECVAVGSGTKGRPTPTSHLILVAETWTAATGWTTSQPVQPGGSFGEFNGISCPTTSRCYAAGDIVDSTGQALPLVERWTAGTWARETLRMPAGASNPSLDAIACPSVGQCAATGGYATSASTSAGLIEQLSGATWTASTAPGSTDGELYGVSCPTTAACEAVGSTPSGSLAEHWAGGRWLPAVPAVPENTFNAGLNGVSCASATHCVAIGETWLNGGFKQIAYITTLNPSWTVTAQTGSGFGIASLNAVSCWSTAVKTPSCALLGGGPDPTEPPLSAFLTGTKWTIVPTV